MKWKLLGCSIALCLTANVWAQVPDPDSDLGEEMQTLVKRYITRNPEVSVDDAITRLAVQTEIMQSMEDLRQEFSDRLTEISLQHTPDQHILVELKGASSVADRVVRTESGTTRVVFETGHKYTKQEFYAILDKHMDLLYSAIPGATGFLGRPGEDRLVIYIEGNEEKAEELQTTVKKLERVLGFAITLRPNMSKSPMSSTSKAARCFKTTIRFARLVFPSSTRPQEERGSRQRRIVPTISFTATTALGRVSSRRP